MATIAKDLQQSASDPIRKGSTLREMIAERDRLTTETGHYYGVKELTLRDSDPIKYERFYSKLHASVLAARESARFVAASPGSREMGEVLWGIATPEGDTLSRVIRILISYGYIPDGCPVHGEQRLRRK